MNSALTKVSSNGKTGPIAVSTTSRASCAPGCPLAGDEGCYADAGMHTRDHWNKVTDGSRGVPPQQFIDQVRALRPGWRHMLRHNVAGDLWHDDGNIIWVYGKALAEASAHLKAAWTYTHHKLSAANQLIIHLMNKAGMTVNCSTESRDEAARITTELALPAVCVVPPDAPPHFRHGGVLFRQCPATFEGSPTTCADCGNGRPLCSIAVRDFVITFPTHGNRATKAASHCS